MPKGTDSESGCCCCCCCYGSFNCVKAVKERTMPACCKFPPIEFVLTLVVGGLKLWMVRYYIPLLRKPYTGGDRIAPHPHCPPLLMCPVSSAHCPPLLMSPVYHCLGRACKVFVIVAFAAFTGVSAFFAAQLKQDFQFRWFVNDDAPLQQAFDVQDEYFASSGLPVYVVTPSSTAFDYASISGQQTLLAMSGAMAGSKWIESDSVSRGTHDQHAPAPKPRHTRHARAGT